MRSAPSLSESLRHSPAAGHCGLLARCVRRRHLEGHAMVAISGANIVFELVERSDPAASVAIARGLVGELFVH